ncbi:Kinase suppressor of Ras 2 [Papilio machaon]|uniref:Kinase suppressor of Ras 2 n=1 Tax=Papilio machaon TaxID=76193 RepID=A0A0N0PAV9_PAPMA|nr:Kinase suppressor of Ras 2 [Papilio machaon]
MDAENEYEIKRARDAIQMIETIQSMIDVSADRLEGLRTQCSTSAELTQQEIRTLEGKLVKHFSRQLVFKAQFGEELQRELGDVPCLAQWLRVVGLSPHAIEAVCSRVATLEALRERSDHELRALLAAARDEELRRLCRAMQRLRTYTEALARGEGAAELPLYWDSWERHARSSPRPRKGGKSPTTPVSKRKQNSHLPAPAALTKSRSHESQLSVRPDASDLSDNSQSSARDATEGAEGSPPGSPRDDADSTPQRLAHPVYYPPVHCNNTISGTGTTAPRSPRTPTVGRCMAHDIAHRFTKTFNMIATCDYCDKQMLFGAGLKCKECKFKCHRDCESKVPPSCGLPAGFVVAFKEKFHKDAAGGSYLCASPSGKSAGFLSSLTSRPRRRRQPPQPRHYSGGPDSSSNTSSCNSSTPSSPALAAPTTPQHAHHAHAHGHAHAHAHTHNAHAPNNKQQQFHFPEIKPPVSSPNHNSVVQSPVRPAPDNKDDLTSSVKSVYGWTVGWLECWKSVWLEYWKSVWLECWVVEMLQECTVGMLEEFMVRMLEECMVGLLGGWNVGRVYGWNVGRVYGWNVGWLKCWKSVWLECWKSLWLECWKSLSMKEWDIPYDELKLFEVIGAGRFGTVYRGSWHGAVAVKLLHVHSLSDHCAQLDTFKHEVATFRKTRHENLVLFMGACMKPPRLAIVTSLCKGMTLYTHIHLRKDKFTANKSVIVAQQISQGMGYLHARGILHKDLKTKNIFLENGKVVITDFGLFSVTKLCFSNNARGDSLGIPPGWLCYLAPELVRALRPHASLHLPFSKCTDVYAFGTVWYELLCGEYPFKGQPPEAIIWQVGKGVKPSLANMQASRDIKDILMLCWSYRSSERPDFPHLLSTLEKLPRKRLARSPSHPVHLSRSADSVF